MAHDRVLPAPQKAKGFQREKDLWLSIPVASARPLENFLRVATSELPDFARLTGNDAVHSLSIHDLCTTNSEIPAHTGIEHV